jgi:hypothetical protein
MVEPGVDAGRRAPPRPRLIVAGALIGFVIARLGAVDVAGIITNDSLGYLRRAEDPFGAGFVSQGYRQAAYPLFVTASNVVGDLFGWDHFLGVALLQRLVLATALAATIWALRWWSIPIVAVATSETFVVHTDLLLTEGLLVPMCLLMAALAAAVAVGRVTSVRSARVVLITLCGITFVGGSLKLQYGLLGALAVASAFLLVGDSLVTTRFARASVGAALGLLVALGIVQSVENRAELGVLEPVSERARAEWYGAWQAVFTVDRGNRRDPALTEFYDGGDLYHFLHGIERTVTDYPARAAIIRDRVDSMFAAADTSARREQLRAFVGGLGMGRVDDLYGIVNQSLASGDVAELRSSFNRVAHELGSTELVGSYNDGEPPGLLSFGGLFDPAQALLDDHRDLKSPVAWISIATMVSCLFVRGRHRPFVTGALMVVVGSAAAMATGYIDNARYLLGPFAVCIVGGTVALRALVRSPIVNNVKERIR